MSEEEKKATHFENIEDLISNCKNWIYEEDKEAFHRWFDFGAMEDLINLIEKQNKELGPIRELGIPVETAVAELNRLKDLEDDREQLKQEIEVLKQYSIPKAEIREMLEELDRCSINFDNSYWVSMGAVENILKELLREEI